MVEATGKALRALRQKLARGNEVTLVLGAGISIARGVPGWVELATRLAVKAGVPLPDDFHRAHPQALPIVFELAEARLKKQSRSFATTVRAELYRRIKSVRGDTLAAVAAYVRREQASASRRLARVITFNADDLLEHEVNLGTDPLAAPVVWPIARDDARPRRARGAGGRPPIDVYHVHGFLPRAGSPLARRADPDGLVFTDAQYWDSLREPLGFPNRVMLNALHDSVCVFLGLSMTDLNIARWLGTRQAAMRAKGTEERAVRFSLDHHFWVRRAAPSASPEAFVTPLLRERGIRTIEIADWSEVAPLLASLA